MNLALAVKYGTNEALFLTNLCFWIEKNQANRAHYYEGRYWVYNTMEAWTELFPYFSKDQIRHLIEKMRQKNILLVGVFNRTKYDRTQWYSVNDEVMALYRYGAKEDKTPPEEGAPKSPGGQMQVGKVPSPSAPEGKSMWENSQMEVGHFPDGSGKSPTPIPDNKRNKKPDADAGGGADEPAAAADSNGVEKLKRELRAIDRALVFGDEFYAKAAGYLEREGLSGEYLSWLYRECKKKRPRELRGLYYRLFFEGDMRELFRGQEPSRSGAGREPAVCPVCGDRYQSGLHRCPGCGFGQDETGNEAAVRWHKKYWGLSAEEKAEYHRERSAVLSAAGDNPGVYREIKDQWLAIDKKYHLTE
jgi:hypothetical protein